MTIPLIPGQTTSGVGLNNTASWLVQHVECSDVGGVPASLLGEASKQTVDYGRRVLILSGNHESENTDKVCNIHGTCLKCCGCQSIDVLLQECDVEYLDAENLQISKSDWNSSDYADPLNSNDLSATIAQRIETSTNGRTVVIDTRHRPLASPLLAVLIAWGLSAVELQFLDTTEGIFTADPGMVSMAQLLPVLSFAEWAELATFDRDLNNIAIKQALRRNIPVRIQSIHHAPGSGTLIHPNPDAITPVSLTTVDVIQGKRVSDFAAQGQGRRTKVPTAVIIKEHVQVLEISSQYSASSASFISGVFNVLNRFGIVTDLMSTSKVHVSVAVQVDPASEVLGQLIEELVNCGTTVSVREDMAILSLVGRHMPSMIGIAGHMFSTLAKRNVNIEMMSQSASEMNISCVISGKDAVKALNLVHHACLSSFSGSVRNDMSMGQRSVY